MILKFHDLTEHHWEKNTEDIRLNTRSVNRGFLAGIVFSHLPRGLHREHHLFPKVCVVDLAQCGNPPVQKLPRIHAWLVDAKGLF